MKFISCLKQKMWILAAKELETADSYFGFWRSVPELCTKMHDECEDEATQFCAAFILNLSKLECIDGRDEMAVITAKQVVKGIFIPDDNEDAFLQLKMKMTAIHPTILQQMAQVAFYFVDTDELRRDCLTEDELNWWVMPLI